MTRLALHTSLGLGGPAREFWTLHDEDGVRAAVEDARRRKLDLVLLGGGSNLVVADEGVDQVVIQLTQGTVEIEEHDGGALARVNAGMVWDDWVALSVERGLWGIECLSGIPGQVGATPIQNVGAYGQEVADTVTRVRVLDRVTGASSWLSAAECAFGYRTSRFKGPDADRLLILAVEFALGHTPTRSASYPELERALADAGMPPSLPLIRRTVLDLRRRKSMLLDPADENGRSCGSFFTNPVVSPADLARVTARAGDPPPSFPQADGRIKMPAAWLIERAGLAKGTRSGNVGLSTRHTLALVAHAGATARELVAFAWHVRDRVETTFGIRLLPEPVFWGFAQLDDGLPTIS